jgi:hypothetical protein
MVRAEFACSLYSLLDVYEEAALDPTQSRLIFTDLDENSSACEGPVNEVLLIIAEFVINKQFCFTRFYDKP